MARPPLLPTDGPHSGARNSSLGLATLRPDGFASLTAKASGALVTRRLRCSGRTLHVTADLARASGNAPGGEVRIGAAAWPAALRADQAVAVRANGTNVPIRYAGGADWASLIGQEVRLEIRLVRASLYSVGWL